MLGDDYDDYDFVPTTKSNLASLFGLSQDSSLTYTAPKQPKPQKTEETNTKPETSVISAKVVNTWKLENGQYTSLGKHGLAIIGSFSKKEYEVILYKDKTNVIARVKITPNFIFTVKENNYATFFDIGGQNWSIRFTTDADKDSFISEFEKNGGAVKLENPLKAQFEKPAILEKTPKLEKPTTIEKPQKLIDDDAQSDTSDGRQKADILSRIARMGQAMLPKIPNNKTQSTDSEDDYYDDLNKSIEPAPVTSTQIIAASPVAPQCDPLNFYLLENRAQNSEIRLNISQLSAKLDQILNRVETGSGSKENNENHLKSKIKVLELRVENLSRELEKYQELCINLQDELKNRQSSLQIEENHKKEIDHYLKRIQDFEKDMEKLNKILEEQRDELEKEKVQSGEMMEVNKKQEGVITELNSAILDLETKLKAVNDKENEAKPDDFVEELKNSMNLMFNSIMSNFSENKDFNYSQIEAVIGQNIKSSTFKLIQKYQNNQ